MTTVNEGPSGAQPEIIVRGLRKSFGDVAAVDGIDLEVPAGTVLGLLGPNGSGKTTTVSMLSTLVRPDAGEVTIAGCDLASDPSGVRAAVSLTGQYAALDETQTVRENLVLFGRLTGLSRAEARARAEDMAGEFGLEEFLDRRTGALSGGMRRRADTAAALVTRPRVLFLDEPTTGLDPRSRQAVWDTVRSLRHEGVTVLLTTQYLEEADLLADRIVMLRRGRVVAEGTPAELKRQAGSAVIGITLEDPADRARALEAVGASGDAGRAGEPDAAGGSAELTVPAPRGIADVAEVARALEDVGVPVHDLGLRRPTLDEVFLQLTGDHAVDSDSDADSGDEPGEAGA
ncbi:ATP-binding cassette domain-containing protein [Corynebacterium sp.]|uniref:ATP-binding cassette domain-containing protein n=1 Tax=Corynebacterium sp. TaxID=1720 RepID=UPI0026DD76CB|nr:ATP-binding cassette domain-containing protein [Corynebacterium sp.]MDO4610071.1 ATP-binding cassette domain-containing protein [Corynebacterium sp.]